MFGEVFEGGRREEERSKGRRGRSCNSTREERKKERKRVLMKVLGYEGE